jgi:hypothetical protein
MANFNVSWVSFEGHGPIRMGIERSGPIITGRSESDVATVAKSIVSKENDMPLGFTIILLFEENDGP